jgi:hypothetical protein
MSKTTEIEEQMYKKREHGDPRGSRRILAKRPHVTSHHTTKPSGEWDSIKEDGGAVASGMSVGGGSVSPISAPVDPSAVYSLQRKRYKNLLRRKKPK